MNEVLTRPLPLPAVAELCTLYRQTEERMVSELIAFCTSAGKSCLTGEILSSFEHEVRATVSFLKSSCCVEVSADEKMEALGSQCERGLLLLLSGILAFLGV